MYTTTGRTGGWSRRFRSVTTEWALVRSRPPRRGRACVGGPWGCTASREGRAASGEAASVFSHGPVFNRQALLLGLKPRPTAEPPRDSDDAEPAERARHEDRSPGRHSPGGRRPCVQLTAAGRPYEYAPGSPPSTLGGPVRTVATSSRSVSSTSTLGGVPSTTPTAPRRRVPFVRPRSPVPTPPADNWTDRPRVESATRTTDGRTGPSRPGGCGTLAQRCLSCPDSTVHTPAMEWAELLHDLPTRRDNPIGTRYPA